MKKILGFILAMAVLLCGCDYLERFNAVDIQENEKIYAATFRYPEIDEGLLYIVVDEDHSFVSKTRCNVKNISFSKKENTEGSVSSVKIWGTETDGSMESLPIDEQGNVSIQFGYSVLNLRYEENAFVGEFDYVYRFRTTGSGAKSYSNVPFGKIKVELTLSEVVPSI